MSFNSNDDGFLDVFLVVVSNILYFHPYLGKIPMLTKIFQICWNHQPVLFLFVDGCLDDMQREDLEG